MRHETLAPGFEGRPERITRRCDPSAATLALWPVASSLTPLILSAATTLILVAIATYELVWLSRHPEVLEDVVIEEQN